LVKRADEILAARTVESGLAPHRAVDHREKRGWDLSQGHAAEQGRGGERGQVADHAASDADDDGSPVDFGFESGVPHALHAGDGLVRLVPRKPHFDWRFAGQSEVGNGICGPLAVIAPVENQDGITCGVFIRPNTHAMPRAAPHLNTVGAFPKRDDDGREVSQRHNLCRNFLSIERPRVDDGMRFGVCRGSRRQDSFEVSLRIIAQQRTALAFADSLLKHGWLGGQCDDNAFAKEPLSRLVIDDGPAAKRNDAHIRRKRLQRLFLESPKGPLPALSKNLRNGTTRELFDPLV
jgi:hypothetical protein